MSLAYFRIGRVNEAVECAKKAVELANNKSKYKQSMPDFWNKLGLVSVKEQKSLAQHAFIQGTAFKIY